MKKSILLAAVMLFMFGGCSAKEFEDGANGIANDISRAFEAGRDK